MNTVLQNWAVGASRELAPAGTLQAGFVVGGFWSVAGAVISRGFLLATSVGCAWFLGKEGFGALGMIQSTGGMFGILAGLELGRARGVTGAGLFGDRGSVNGMLGQPLVAAHKMWWRFGSAALFVVLLVGLAWVVIPKRGALGLTAAYGLAYACTNVTLFLFDAQSRWSSSRH